MTELLVSRLDRILAANFGPGKPAPSAVLLVAGPGETIAESAVGGVGADTVFDLASVTKAAATVPLLMKLVESGAVGLDRPLVELLPEWEGGPLAAVSLRQLLSHRAGLWEWRPVYLHAGEPAAAIDFVLGLEPRRPPGTVRAYSDLGVMVAGEVLRRATGRALEGLVEDWLAGPLGLTRTRFRPPPEWSEEIAPTSPGDWYERRMLATGRPYPIPETGSQFDGWRSQRLLGEANDGNAFHAFGGVAAHAGLFASARDLALLGLALAGGGVASPAILADFMTEAYDEGQGSIFRIRTLAGRRALWHSGFTGTRWLVCPDLDLVVVLLASRLDVEGEPQPLDPVWDQVLTAVEESPLRRS